MRVVLIKFLLCMLMSAGAQTTELIRLDSLAKLYLNDSVSLALSYAQQELSLANQTNNRVHQFIALNRLATAHLINDDYDLALEHSLDALELARQLNQAMYLAEVNTTLGWLYYDIHDARQALLYHSQALEQIKQTPDSLAACTSLNAIGLAYLLQNKFTEALSFFRQALQLGNRIKDDERVMAALSNIGESFHGLGRKDEALAAMRAALPLAQKHPDILREAELQNSIASVLISSKQFKLARTALGMADTKSRLSNSNARKEVLMQNALLLVEYFKSLKQYDSAFQALEQYDSLREQILSDTKKINLMNKKASWESDRAEKEMTRLKKDHELRVNQRNTIAIGIIFLTVIGFFVYSRERQLRLKEQELTDAREALTKTELEKAEVERLALSEKLEFKNRELTNYALHISQRNDLQRAFLDEIESFRKAASPELTQQLNKVVKQFSTQEEINKDAEAFHVNVELENKDFFFNLAQKYPDLTENEKRLCAQVRLNLSIKDIASVNNISVKAVEMARYRLRKKLNVPHDDNLTDFLKTV